MTLNFFSETQNCRKWSKFCFDSFCKVLWRRNSLSQKQKNLFNSVIKHSSKLKMRNRGVNIREKEDKISHKHLSTYKSEGIFDVFYWIKILTGYFGQSFNSLYTQNIQFFPYFLCFWLLHTLMNPITNPLLRKEQNTENTLSNFDDFLCSSN